MVCSFASLTARDSPAEEAREVILRKSVTRKEVEGEELNVPQPKDSGHNVGTMEWIA